MRWKLDFAASKPVRIVLDASKVAVPGTDTPPRAMSPSDFRSDGPKVYPPPGMLFDYRPPSFFAEHRALALVFLTACIALAAYCLMPHARKSAPLAQPPVQPVYVEPLSSPP